MAMVDGSLCRLGPLCIEETGEPRGCIFAPLMWVLELVDIRSSPFSGGAGCIIAGLSIASSLSRSGTRPSAANSCLRFGSSCFLLRLIGSGLRGP